MRLFLASEAKHPDSIKKLEEYLGGFKDKSIAYIPTAANGERWESWKDGGSWSLLNSLDIKLEKILLEDYGNDSVIEKIANKDVVWFAGGMVGYLLYWMKRCSLDNAMADILKKTVYVGSSAGAMVLCPNSTEIATWSFVDNELGANEISPLKVVDFDIYPHYEESLYEKIKENYNGKKLYLLKNGEEIIVENGRVTVIGEERIISNT
ncbi:MAG: Type 1 glutamine amidotransferase-like domain-containing protein [Candidatus Woesebacteria bacterium]|nr:MAG: Type 1 glutamine amidotransferase-like domain-containing protein [Candidatus Woesebacteria bacterium]